MKAEGGELTVKHPCLQQTTVELQKALQSDFKRVEHMLKTIRDSVNRSVHAQQFDEVYDDIETKTKQMVCIFFNARETNIGGSGGNIGGSSGLIVD